MAHEAARVRQLHSYYQPWVETFQASDPQVFTPAHVQPAKKNVARSSRDKALIAFAQLGCLRLGLKRGVVTLVDNARSYILAEATRTLSLLDDRRHLEEDELWFGNATIPRDQGVSEDSMYPPWYTATAPGQEDFTARALVIPDIAKVDRYQGRKYTGNGVSFYAGVPITTPAGFVIGVYNITDDKPRSGLTPDELHFLVDMSVIVMEHLQVIKSDRARARGEQLIRGIGAFIKGNELSNHSPNSRRASMGSRRSTTTKLSGGDVITTERDLLSSVSRSQLIIRETGDATTDQTRNETRAEQKSDAPGKQLDHPVSNLYEDNLPDENNPQQDAQQDNSLQYNPPQDNPPQDNPPQGNPPRNKTTENSPFTTKDDPTHISIQEQPDGGSQPSQHSRLYTRAASILLQCMNADGVVVLDASSANLARATRTTKDSENGITSVEHSETQRGRNAEAITPTSSQGPFTDTSDAYSQYESTSDASESDSSQIGRGSRPRYVRSSSSAPPCDTLACVFRDLNHQFQVRMSERSLGRYIRCHPKGQCFLFDENGQQPLEEYTMSSASADAHSSAEEGTVRPGLPSQRHRRSFRTNAVLKALPRARSVVFLPLWDFTRERWNSCILIWSNDHVRLMHASDDLAYLTAFGNSVMNEIARLNLAVSDTAKATFLANISHELRSPLHGILGSIEFLHEVSLDDFQAALLISVETCCKTLLDTVNHVLDYSKINKITKTSVKDRRQLRLVDGDMTTDMNLATIVEDAVEAVYAGQVFRSADLEAAKVKDAPRFLPSRAAEKRMELRERIKTSVDGFARRVMLTLNIESGVDWTVCSQAGAIGRVVMNLLGNSLKYTKDGSIDVSLKVDHLQPEQPSTLHACLSVIDTGQGMTPDFLRNHAFTAFSQENSFNAGNGLGLSIVRQIVDSLGGRIDLRSQKDKGTEIKVWLSLPTGTDTSFNENNSVEQVQKATQGMTICTLIPPTHVPRPPCVALSSENMPTVEGSVRDLAKAWFGMQMFSSETMDDVVADFFLYAEPPPIEYLMEFHGRHDVDSEVPVIILCENAIEAATLHANGIHQLTDIGRIIEIVAQPCGPQKLAKLLHRCLVRTEKLARMDNAPRDRPVSPTVKEVDPLPDIRPSERSGSAGESSKHDETPEPEPSQMPEVPRRPKPKSRVSFDTRTDSERAPKPAESTLDTSDPPSLLVVDDNPINLRLLVTFAQKHRHPHETAVDGSKALEAYKRRALAKDGSKPFEFILMDISMPIMDGITATREIRRFERENDVSPPTVVIALTGLGSGSAQEEAFENGFNFFMTKPVKFKELEKMLEQKQPSPGEHQISTKDPG